MQSEQQRQECQLNVPPIDSAKGVFHLNCPTCEKASDWSFYTVINRSTSPLSHIGMKCNTCGKLVIVPMIAFTLQHIGHGYWSN